MAKPDEIPQDIWDTADDHVFRHIAVSSDRLMVARAILAERLRMKEALRGIEAFAEEMIVDASADVQAGNAAAIDGMRLWQNVISICKAEGRPLQSRKE